MTTNIKSLNLSSFRTDGTLIDAQTKMQDSKPFRQLMELLMSELPSKHALPFGSEGTDFACAHGMEVGYLRCIETMKAAAEPAPVGEPVADFATEDD